jgi:hypothetical protein
MYNLGYIRFVKSVCVLTTTLSFVKSFRINIKLLLLCRACRRTPGTPGTVFKTADRKKIDICASYFGSIGFSCGLKYRLYELKGFVDDSVHTRNIWAIS